MPEPEIQLLNPYTAGRPVVGDRFFGRDQIFQALHEALVMSQQRVVVLHGQRRIGKSSILQELPDKLPPGYFKVVNFDLQFYAGQSLTAVLLALAKAICRKVDVEPPAPSLFEEDEFYFEKTLLVEIEQTLPENQRLLILIDEFDIIRETEKERVPVASREFTSILQRLINSDKRLSFLLVAGSKLGSLSGYMQSVFRLGATVRVALLDREEADALITKPARDLLTYTPQSIEAILDLTSGHPYFTQLLCLEIFNRTVFSKKMEISRDEVQSATRKSLISGMGAFSWIWNELNLAERVYLSAVALTVSKQGAETVSDKEIQATLEEYGIRLVGADLPNAAKDLMGRQFLGSAGPYQYRFTVKLIRLWIEKEHPLDSTKQDIENVNPIARAKYEDARKAYQTGKLDRAADLFQAAVRVNPNHVRAQLGLAQVFSEKRDWERAVAEYERAFFLDEINAKPGLIDAMLAYGTQLEKEGDSDKALSVYKRTLKYAPGNEQAAEKIEQLAQGCSVLRLRKFPSVISPSNQLNNEGD